MTRVRSVRARTTLMATAIVAVTLVAGSIGLLLTLQHSLTTSRDAVSRTLAGDLALRAADGSLTTRITKLNDDVVAQVVDDGGRVRAASSGLIGHGPISTYAPPGTHAQRLMLRGVPDDNETENYRVWAVRAPVPGGSVRVYVGASLESVSQAVSTLRTLLLVGVPAIVVVLALTTRLMVGRALRPVEDIRAEVAAITDGRLDRRVPVPASADEVSRLAGTMNAMLGRLETSSRRQREFVADASHELQSPLAAVRAQLEVAGAHPESTNWPALARDLLADSDHMERLVRDLLFLARDDAGADERAGAPVDLDVIVLEEVARLRASVAVEIDTSGVSGAPTVGVRDDLARMVRNVLENAADHARSRVTVAVSSSPGRVEVVIGDDGPGIPAELRGRVFDRFARVETARPRRRGGTGLGLSIALVIAQRHAGTIDIGAAENSSAPHVGAVGVPAPSVATGVAGSVAGTRVVIRLGGAPVTVRPPVVGPDVHWPDPARRELGRPRFT